MDRRPAAGRNIVEVSPDYRLVYASDHVRELRRNKETGVLPEINVPSGEAYIRLQSHWGSGVTFTEIVITPRN